MTTSTLKCFVELTNGSAVVTLTAAHAGNLGLSLASPNVTEDMQFVLAAPINAVRYIKGSVSTTSLELQEPWNGASASSAEARIGSSGASVAKLTQDVRDVLNVVIADNAAVAGVGAAAANAVAKAGEAALSAATATTKAGEASASATTASAAAATATTKAGEASTSATTATTKAGEASTSATMASTACVNAATKAVDASTSATTATTKAGEASASATTASAAAATATTKAGEASTSATTATTKAGEASTSATTASTAAATATTQAGAASTSAATATTKAGEASAAAAAAAASAASASSGGEPAIAAGTNAQYWQGDKTWQNFALGVRSAVLTGLSTATNAVVLATDVVLVAIGKLQAQINGYADAAITFTNKTLTNPVINGFTGTGNASITGLLTVTNKVASLAKNSTGLTEFQVGNTVGAANGDGNGVGFYFGGTRLAGIRSAVKNGIYKTTISAWSGSAEVEVIDIDTGGNTVIGAGGTQIAGAKLSVSSASAAYIGVGGGRQVLLGDDGTVGFLGTLTNHDLVIRTNNIERARILTSGVLSIPAGIASENVIAPTLLNGWSNYGGFQAAGYWKDAFGIVHLRGLISGTALSTTAFILPSGYRPPLTELFIVSSASGSVGSLLVDVSGNVYITGGSTAWISLTGITFRANT